MPDHDFDLVVIGAGSGGTRAARFAASQHGARVACVELPFGFIPSNGVGGAGGTCVFGSCVIRGCVPKKLLVYGSAFSEEFRDARGFGWSASQPPFDWKQLVTKKAAEVERLNTVYNRLLASAGVNMFEGRASIVDGHTVRVALAAGGERLLTTERILIATGGHAVKAPIEGSEHAITSDEALALDTLPRSHPIVVVGAGYIALEFASIFSGLGCTVHVLYRKPLPLAGFDDECRAHVATCMAGRGVAMHPETSPNKIEKNGDGSFTVHFVEHGAPSSLKAGLIMFGTGRAPNTAGLGLDGVGVATDGKTGAIVVDAASRTSVPAIYAIGDVTDRMNLTPVAIMEAMAFVETAFGGGAAVAPRYDRIATAVFTQPPMAACGLTEQAAVATLPGPVDVYTSKFRPMRNTLSGRDEATLMKLVVDAGSGEVVGAHMVGPDAAEIMQGVAIAMKCGATKADFDGTVGIHPTAAEEFVTMRTRTRRVEGNGA